MGGNEVPWMKNIPQDEIMRRMSETEDNDPAVLMDFFRDPETGIDKDLLCIKKLFVHGLDKAEGIEARREEAVCIYIERIPVYSEKSDGKHDEKHCIREFVWHLPRDTARKYGFEIEFWQSENEDEFGRYTSTTTRITYQGKTYCYKF